MVIFEGFLRSQRLYVFYTSLIYFDNKSMNNELVRIVISETRDTFLNFKILKHFYYKIVQDEKLHVIWRYCVDNIIILNFFFEIIISVSKYI